MALVVISIDRDALPKHTDEEFEAWVKYQTGDLGSISRRNPMYDLDMKATVKEVG